MQLTANSTSKDHLHTLIASLAQSEKRYAKVFLQQNRSGDKGGKLVGLFDAINAQKAYDKEALLAHDFVAPSQLSNMKHRLYAHILTALKAYHSGKPGIQQMHESLSSYEILMRKGLYKHCLKLLMVAEDAAWEAGKIHYVKDILEKQKYLVMIRLDPADAKRYLHAIEERIEEAVAITKNLVDFERMDSRLYEVFRVEGRTMRRPPAAFSLQKEFEELLETSAEHRPFFPLAYAKSHAIGLMNQLLGRFDLSIRETEQFFAVYRGNKDVMTNHLKEYNKMLNQHVISLNMVGDYQGVKQVIGQIHETTELATNSEELQLIIFENAIFQELEVYLHQWDFHRAVTHIEANMERVEAYGSQIHSVNIHSKYYRIALAYFGAGKTKEALKWNNRILSLDKLKYRLDIQSSVLLLNLLIHYELENFKLLEYTIPTTKKQLKKIGRWLAPEQAVLAALSTIIAGGPRRRTFEKLYQTLEQNIEQTPLDAYAMAYFDVLRWVKERC